jgi:hypothetical protein
MCFAPKIKQQKLPLDQRQADLNAEELMLERQRRGGFASTLVASEAARNTGTAASKLLLGQ